MREFGLALVLGLLPAAGNIAGGVIAEFAIVSRKAISLSLHAAAGIVLAVVAVELLPEALEAEPRWLIIAAFAAGGLCFVLIDHVAGLVASSRPEGGGKGPWMIFIAVAIDLFADGVMVGTGSTVRFTLALMLGLAQLPANMPEGFATIATMRHAGVPRARRILALALLTVAVAAGTAAGYWLLRTQPLEYRMATLAFTAGILTTLVVEEIVPESHQGGEARVAVLYLIGGFVLLMTFASYVD